MITLYSTGCPKCKVLEQKMDMKNIKYEKITDVDIMTEKGFMSVPMLDVDGEIMDFKTANNWVNEVNI